MSIATRFERLLRDAPSAPFAWTAAGVRDRAEFGALVATFAQLLDDLPRGVRIAVSVRDGFAFLAALLATWRHGSAALLLDAGDPRAPRRDLATSLGAAAVLTADPLPGVERSSPDQLAAAGVDAVIKLTSGSTGAPRGVATGFAQLEADSRALEAAMEIGARDRILAAVPMSFSYGLGSIAVPALAFGRELVLPEVGSPLGLRTALRHGRPTVLPAVPALIRGLVVGESALTDDLRLVISAGARLGEGIAGSFHAKFGRRVHAFYGASECGGISYDRGGDAAARGSVGAPIDGVTVAITAEGRVSVRSPAVARATLPDDGSIRDGVFTTTDLGELRSGELVLLGRCSEMIDVGGFKVPPREVERTIAELAGIDDVVVVPWQSSDGRAVCAAIVAAAGGIDEARIWRHCAASLPPHMVPRKIAVVAELPRDERGKLSGGELRRLLERCGGAEQLTS